MYVECWFDGSTEPINPGGDTSYGALVKCNGKIVLSESGYVGVGPEMSNNVGEYAGCIAVLKFLLKENIAEAIIYGDSKMVVRQLAGKMKARKGLYIPYYKMAIVLVRQLPRVRFQWIPREKNTHADWLSRQAIKTAPQAVGRKEELKELIKEQKADMKDQRLRFDGPDFYPKLIRKVNRNYGASRLTKGTPF